MVICLFYSDISAQIVRAPSTTDMLGEEPSALSPDCSSDFNVTTDGCCAILNFTPSNVNGINTETWNLDNGWGPQPAYNIVVPMRVCYTQAGNYTLTRTVNGCTPVSKRITITTIACPPPCPQILDIDIVTTNTWNPSSIPSRTCSPLGFVGDDNGNVPELNKCSYRFTPVLNTNSSGFTFNWEAWIEDDRGDTYFNCAKTGVPDFYVVNNKGTPTYFIRVKVTGTSPTCGGTITKSKRIVLNQPLACTYNVVQFRSNDDDTYNESLALNKKVSATSNVQIYPNPASDILHVSNLDDSENYTFDIHNTLGQTVLSQKVSSIDAAVNVTDLTTGVYIGIVKSQGKIIATQKIYKK
jgi:hypothetical protein